MDRDKSIGFMSTCKNSYQAWIVFVCFILAVPVQASDPFPEEFTQADRELVVKATGVLVKENGTPKCQATRISQDKLLSAAHCISHFAFDGRLRESWPLAFQSVSEWDGRYPLRSSFPLVPSTDFHVGSRPFDENPLDWALIKADSKPDEVIPPFAEKISVGDTIYLSQIDLVSKEGFSVSRCQVIEIEKNGFIRHSCPTEQGSSGAGLLAKKGPNGTLVLVGSTHSSFNGVHQYPLGSWVHDWLPLFFNSWNEIGQMKAGMFSIP